MAYRVARPVPEPGPGEVVLLFTPTGRDAELMRRSLEESGHVVRVERAMDALCRGLATDGGVAVLAEEALSRGAVHALIAALTGQPSWSDFPLIVLTAPSPRAPTDRGLLHSLRQDGNVTLVERPLHPLTLISAVDTALRARRRQYQVRDYLVERAQGEERIRQAQKMDAVGQLAGGVAHEVNNMMTAVIGFGELALRQLGSADPLRADVEEMVKAGHRAASITQQLLAFSRRQRREPVILTLSQVIAGLTKLLHRLLGAAIDLEVRISEDLPPIRVDRNQLEQVLINLAVNARDAMPAGGRLVIAAETVRLGPSFADRHGLTGVPDVRYVQIRVTDDGDGMDRQTQDRAFEPFFTTKDVGKGTGLGLSTVYGIVKQSDGYIWLYSEPGLGTTVKVYLPEHQGDGALPAADPEPLVRGDATVLVVEDEEMVRRLARAALESHGYKVLEAADGVAALRRLCSHSDSVALVVTDTVMPGLNGRELAQRVRASHPDLPILFMSGYAGDDVADRGLLDADAPFLQKPFSPDELVRRVQALLPQPARADSRPATRSGSPARA